MTARQFDGAAIVTVLNRHRVRYVVIGAFAALAQQAPIEPTQDLDIAPDASPENLERLSRALKELGARIRTDGVDAGLPFDHDATSLGRSQIWNLVCRFGDFDVCFQPSGIDGGYAELMVRAHRVRVEGVEVEVADLDDVIRSKEAAGRPRDLRVLPALYRYRATRAEPDR